MSTRVPDALDAGDPSLAAALCQWEDDGGSADTSSSEDAVEPPGPAEHRGRPGGGAPDSAG